MFANFLEGLLPLFITSCDNGQSFLSSSLTSTISWSSSTLDPKKLSSSTHSAITPWIEQTRCTAKSWVSMSNTWLDPGLSSYLIPWSWQSGALGLVLGIGDRSVAFRDLLDVWKKQHNRDLVKWQKEQADHGERQEMFTSSKQTPANFLRSLCFEKKHETTMARNERGLATLPPNMLYKFLDFVFKDYEEQTGETSLTSDVLLRLRYHHAQQARATLLTSQRSLDKGLQLRIPKRFMTSEYLFYSC